MSSKQHAKPAKPKSSSMLHYNRIYLMGCILQADQCLDSVLNRRFRMGHLTQDSRDFKPWNKHNTRWFHWWKWKSPAAGENLHTPPHPPPPAVWSAQTLPKHVAAVKMSFYFKKCVFKKWILRRRVTREQNWKLSTLNQNAASFKRRLHLRTQLSRFRDVSEPDFGKEIFSKRLPAQPDDDDAWAANQTIWTDFPLRKCLFNCNVRIESVFVAFRLHNHAAYTISSCFFFF